jgi:hypothetical protein
MFKISILYLYVDQYSNTRFMACAIQWLFASTFVKLFSDFFLSKQ